MVDSQDFLAACATRYGGQEETSRLAPVSEKRQFLKQFFLDLDHVPPRRSWRIHASQLKRAGESDRLLVDANGQATSPASMIFCEPLMHVGCAPWHSQGQPKRNAAARALTVIE
jgi:hypothetical protein